MFEDFLTKKQHLRVALTRAVLHAHTHTYIQHDVLKHNSEAQDNKVLSEPREAQGKHKDVTYALMQMQTDSVYRAEQPLQAVLQHNACRGGLKPGACANTCLAADAYRI